MDERDEENAMKNANEVVCRQRQNLGDADVKASAMEKGSGM